MKLAWRGALLCLTAGVLALSGCAGGMRNTGSSKELLTASDQTQQQKRADIRLQLAVSYYGQQQWEIALDEVKQALQSWPEFADAYGLRGLIYMEMGENALADENFQRALKLAPNNPDLSNNYGWFLCRSGRGADGLKYFDAALKMRNYSSPEKALNNAGSCSLTLRQYDQAEQYLREAFRLDPAGVMTNSNLAKLYFQQKDYQRANFYLTRVVKQMQDQIMPADILWLGIRMHRKQGDSAAEQALATQLRRHHPKSNEFKDWQRGAFDE
ncbi:type IV pilus biogenesis/stability protein PilW [Massilia sp. W12]|uniref:type IV pilus biogenesis/stability protein PilW n=1 Tax=Massilia sp. W12 TaxID=3126507 RepID=UPI0030D0CB15